MNYVKYLIALVGGLLASGLKMYAPIFIAVAVACLFDFFTGIAAAKLTGDGWNSKVARKGALKKAVMIGALAFGVFLDICIPMAAKQVGFTFHLDLLFSSIIGFYIIFTECVSVCENFLRCCPNSFPKWIIKLLTAGKEHLEHLGEGDDSK